MKEEEAEKALLANVEEGLQQERLIYTTISEFFESQLEQQQFEEGEVELSAESTEPPPTYQDEPESEEEGEKEEEHEEKASSAEQESSSGELATLPEPQDSVDDESSDGDKAHVGISLDEEALGLEATALQRLKESLAHGHAAADKSEEKSEPAHPSEEPSAPEVSDEHPHQPEEEEEEEEEAHGNGTLSTVPAEETETVEAAAADASSTMDEVKHVDALEQMRMRLASTTAEFEFLELSLVCPLVRAMWTALEQTPVVIFLFMFGA